MNKRGKNKKADENIKSTISENEYQERIGELFKYFRDFKYNLISLNKKFDVLENYFKHNIKDHFIDKSEAIADTLEINEEEMKFIEENFQPEKEAVTVKEDPQDLEFFKDSDSEKEKKHVSKGKDILDFEDDKPKFNQVLFDYKNYQSNTKPKSKEVTAKKETRKTNWINKDEKLVSSDTLPLSLDLDSSGGFKGVNYKKEPSYVKKDESIIS